MVLELSQIKTSFQEEMFEIPLIIRGNIIRVNSSNKKEYECRYGHRKFITPDVTKYIDKIALKNPSRMKEIYNVNIEEILDYMSDLGLHLDINENEYLQECFQLSCEAGGLTPTVLYTVYKALPMFLSKPVLTEMIEKRIGIKYLEGWVPTKLYDGRIVSIRAFGSRSVHVIAGNVPLVAAGSIARGVCTRSDVIIKLPSNDPLTATAIAKTMIEMDPTHPVTKLLSVAYWKGGDESFETRFYRPENIEKIIAWGGFASIKHIIKYIQPGIDLINLDPKLSISIIGKEAFQNEQMMRTVAQRAALDVCSWNQEACVNSRVIYVESGTNSEGIANINQLGAYLYYSMVNLPPHISTPAKEFNKGLKANIEGIALDNEFYRVYGGEQNEGAVIISQLDEPVDFSQQLCGRVVNLVPVDSLKTVIRSVNSYTQTIGIFPESLKAKIRDELVIHGVQRIVSLGFASSGTFSTPQDGLEPLRRMCKWVMDESSVQ